MNGVKRTSYMQAMEYHSALMKNMLNLCDMGEWEGTMLRKKICKEKQLLSGVRSKIASPRAESGRVGHLGGGGRGKVLVKGSKV